MISNTTEIPQLPFLVPELDRTEVEEVLRNNPEAAKLFVDKISKGEVAWDAFTPAERGIITNTFIDSLYTDKGELQTLKALKEADWIREPATPEEFVNDPKYLGAEMSKAIYAPWRRDLIFVLDPKNEIHEWVLSGGIGVGKTRIAIIAQLYKLHVLTCLKNIPAYFTLDSATKISFGLFSLSLEKAEGAISDDFKEIINQSPYFKNIFPLKKSRSIKKAMNNAASGNIKDLSGYEIVLPQGLQILVGSKVSHALSFAVVSAILDEMNFRGRRTIKSFEDENSAEKLYDQVRYRISSRFERLGYVPGLLCVISSRKTSSDFLEARIATLDGRLSSKTGSWIAQNDRHAFISSYSQWDVKPDKYFEKGRDKKSFFIFIGSSARSSRILTPEEVKEFPENSPNLIEVPESTRPHFERNVNAALRELAGISSSPTSLLFEDPTLLKNLWEEERKSPFVADEIEIGLKTGRSISSYLMLQNMLFDAGFAVIPKHHPDMLRVMHIDLSKTGDSTGIAMGGVSFIKEVVGTNIIGAKIVSSYSPEFFIDFAVSIKAPQGDQIDYEKIQQFISYLRRMRYKIHLITFDRAMSAGPIQMLKKDGFTVDLLSVDMTDMPYTLLRDAVHNNNIKCPKNLILENELLNLIHDYSGAKAKVDHPARNFNGGKGCFTGETKVKLLDGRNLSFIELEKEFKDKPFYVYTIKDGAVTVGKAFSPRATKSTTELLKIILDNGEEIKCTPDHKFMLRDGSYKEAKDLQPNESLMPLYTKISVNDLPGYEKYFCPKDNKWHYTHRLVGKWKYPGRYTGNQFGEGLIHHTQGKLNNDPENLLLVTQEEHMQIHHQQDIMKRRANPEVEKKRIKNLQEYNSKESTKEAQRNRINKHIHKNLAIKEKVLKAISEIGKKTGRANITKYNKSEQHRKKAAEVGKITIWKAIEACRHPLTIEECISLRNEGLNNPQIAKKHNCSVSMVERRFMQARKKGLLNHKIKSIEQIQCEETLVYDITVEDTHNFALSSGVFVHNSKDISDAVAGVVANAYALLTNVKKYPETANMDIAGKILGNLYRSDDLHKYFVEPTGEEETRLVNEHINSVNPFLINP